jgi:S1-C subfamily serine protease
MTGELNWKLDEEIGVGFGFAIVRAIADLAREQMRDLSDLFPFRGAWKARSAVGNNWIAVTMEQELASQVPTIGEMEADELAELSVKVVPFQSRSHTELYALLGERWFSFSRFTYVGPFRNGYASWQDVHLHLINWLNHCVVHEVHQLNQSRVLRAIPTPPQYDIDSIIKSLWVLESDSHSTQGTAFALRGVGIVTCEHVLRADTVAFKADNMTKKYNVQSISKNSDIDLAIVKIPTSDLQELESGTADSLKQMEHLAIAGFPNYRCGDTGVLVPGLVTGFRTVSGIRRTLTNALIVGGMSGGPVVDQRNTVIGVAVTGADIMENAGNTENHGIIPIDALKYLLSSQE